MSVLASRTTRPVPPPTSPASVLPSANHVLAADALVAIADLASPGLSAAATKQTEQPTVAPVAPSQSAIQSDDSDSGFSRF